MAKKKKKLPDDFEQLLGNSNLEELKLVFDQCELDARTGYGNVTALAFDNCPHLLAKWLVEQGADLHAIDRWGNTALHNRARSFYGNIKSLLELGASVHDKRSSLGTPLHAAARAHNVGNTALLLQYGANVDTLNSSGNTPLEEALQTCRNTDIVNMVELAKIYLNAGVEITNRMKTFVNDIGKGFELHRANFNKEYLDQTSSALEELYRIFEVEPVAKRVMHDGNSLIITNAGTWEEKHQELWNLLVPSTGRAETVQGEVIRITGRIDYELEGNGGINWDRDYKKMADVFLAFIAQGESLPSDELTEAKELVRQIKLKIGDTSRMCDRICELGVKWVVANPVPLILSEVSYKR